ncbi:MAG: type II secretion system F family protein [Proteobacteria bacterium]|nr:type II secretion system F family protein [Pseudomonadota bacterium]
MALIDTLTDPRVLSSALTAVAVAAGVVTLAMPYLDRSDINERMRTVAVERDRIRARERERLSKEGHLKPALRSDPGAKAKRFVEQFNLDKWLSTDTSTEKLMRAGLRGPKAETMFLVARFLAPLGFMAVAGFLMLVHPKVSAMSGGGKLMLGIFAAYLGIKAPEIYLSNVTKKRQESMRKAFPDSLDLLLICVESGMSVEHGFTKVSHEIAPASVELAEELALVTAELSYLPDRRSAYENFAKRSGLDSVRSVCTALIQAERYGTPVGQALRVLAQESRDQRMTDAEKKAAALPPKLTVPMIVFFMPALFIVILSPALIRIFKWQ